MVPRAVGTITPTDSSSDICSRQTDCNDGRDEFEHLQLVVV